MNNTTAVQTWYSLRAEDIQVGYFIVLISLVWFPTALGLAWLSAGLVHLTRRLEFIALGLMAPVFAILPTFARTKVIAYFGIPCFGRRPLLPATCDASLNIEGPYGWPCYISRLSHWLSLVAGPDGMKHFQEYDERWARDLKDASMCLALLIFAMCLSYWVYRREWNKPCETCGGSPEEKCPALWRTKKEIEVRLTRGSCVCRPCVCKPCVHRPCICNQDLLEKREKAEIV